jgi:hypothetical protein
LHRARVFQLEVTPHEQLGVGVERGPLAVAQLEVGEVGVLGQLDASRREGGERRVERALGGRPVEQELERPVHERALAGVRRGRLGQAFEVGEPVREGTLLERRARARRE